MVHFYKSDAHYLLDDLMHLVDNFIRIDPYFTTDNSLVEFTLFYIAFKHFCICTKAGVIVFLNELMLKIQEIMKKKFLNFLLVYDNNNKYVEVKYKY